MYRSKKLMLLVSCLFALAAGCSQKDPDAVDGGAGTKAQNDGGGAAGTGDSGTGVSDSGTAGDGSVDEVDSGEVDAGPVVEKDYFPLIDGSSFVYRHVEGSGNFDDTTKITAAKYKTKAAFLSTGSPDTKNEVSINVFQKIGTKIFRVHKDSTISDVSQGTVDYEPGFLRFDTKWIDQKAGTKNVENYRRVEYNKAGMILDDDDRTHTFTVESLSETITVPAGKLKDCIRVSRKRMLAAGTTAGDDDDKTLWFCPGVGKAKELTVSTGATEELASCKIPGRACP